MAENAALLVDEVLPHKIYFYFSMGYSIKAVSS
jgi:hypothetical protein